MKVLVTGAFGLVGRRTLRELSDYGHETRALDLDTPTNRRYARKLGTPRDIVWGSLTDVKVLSEACQDVDAVIHLGAVIPPLADKQPVQAYYVNVAATELLIRTMKKLVVPPVLVFTSSISVYGDRVKNPNIALNDELRPGVRDYYAQQKVMAEAIVRESELNWAIPRLSYVVSSEKLKLDPIMFEMPLDTSIEIVHVNDVARALRKLVEGLDVERHLPDAEQRVSGRIFHVAGGENCRVTYREYLRDMFRLFGLGQNRFPENVWNTKDFHCGFMDTGSSQNLLRFQKTTLADYYAEVKRSYAVKAFFISLVRPIAWLYLKSHARSPVPHGNSLQLARLASLMRTNLAGLLARQPSALT